MYFVAKPIITNGLVLNLDAGNTLSYTSGSSIWNDLLGTNTSGSFINNPSFQNTNGGFFNLNGTNQYIRLSNNVSNLISNSSTLSFWLYRSTVFNSSAITAEAVFSSYNNDDNRGAIYFSNDSLYQGRLASLLLEGGSITGRVYTQKNNWTEGWYNIVAVRTPSNYKIYVNGVDMPLSVISNTATRAFPLNSIYNLIFGDYYSSLNVYAFLPGNIASTQIYNRELSATEVLQNFNALKGRYGL